MHSKLKQVFGALTALQFFLSLQISFSWNFDGMKCALTTLANPSSCFDFAIYVLPALLSHEPAYEFERSRTIVWNSGAQNQVEAGLKIVEPTHVAFVSP